MLGEDRAVLEPATSLREPRPHLRGAVRRRVVENDVGARGGIAAHDLAHEGEEVGRGMLSAQVMGDLPDSVQ